MKISNEFLTANTAASGMGGNAYAGTSGANQTSNFATLLQQSRTADIGAMANPKTPGPLTAEATPQSTPAAADKSANDESTSSADEAAQANDEAQSNEAAAKPRTPAKPRTRTADNAPAAAARERSHATAQRQVDTQADGAAKKADDADAKTATDSAMPTWITGWAPTAPAPATGARNPAAADAGDAAEASVGGDVIDAGNASGASASGRGRALPAFGAKKDMRSGSGNGNGSEALDRTAADAVKGSDTSVAGAKDSSGTQGFGSILDELRNADAARREEVAGARADARNESRNEAHGDVRIDALQAQAGVSTPATTGPAQSASATAANQMQSAVGSPEFPQELGVKLSLLAKDGVQQAELHLNPAEMGPVSVQIVMDGTQARIDFGADVAATRQAIEAGLPELASALRDAGFTLAGGGVSQHAGSRQGSDADGSRREGASRRIGGTSSAGQSGESQATRVRSTRVSAGGVDLYA